MDKKMILGQRLLNLILEIKPAVLIEKPGEIKEEERIPFSIKTHIGPYIDHAFRCGEVGQRFKSDKWKNYEGWACAVPEIIRHEETLFFGCRYWNTVGGFSAQGRILQATATCPDGVVRSGYSVYKRRIGFQPSSQYFVTDEGMIFEYERIVIDRQPYFLLPRGGANVGSTETHILTRLIDVRLSSEDDLTETIEMIEDSLASHENSGLREIMKDYFVIE